MNRLNPGLTVIKALFAKSKNLCAFPQCNAEMVTDDNIIVGQICHIESPEEGGPRFNPTKTKESLRAYENLMLMCYKHHKIIDTHVDQYPVSKLVEIKKRREESSLPDYEPPPSVIQQAVLGLNAYLTRLEYVSKQRQDRLEVAVDFKNDIPISELGQEVLAGLAKLEKIVESLDVPSSQWEYANIAIPNLIIAIESDVRKLELAFLNCYIKATNNELLKTLFERRKRELTTFVKKRVIVD